MAAPPPADRVADRSVVLAVVIGAHGIAGEVRLKVFTDDLAAYRLFNDGTLTLKSARAGSNGTIARIAEVTDRNAAEALRGTELRVPRSALPPLNDGEYYHADLIGLPCTVDGRTIGRSVAVENYGAGDLLEIEREAGARFLVPVAAAVTIGPEALAIDPLFVES
ncbi:ribosome maturation factor RimM [Sphingomonas sp. CROZ-RG-20F-R02-07]|uniref:ribosome maturation factor RimM n=1 Tax=Sphingomonas sp. CROZ-RG-20F-R02-07 TaxID=2914832 RepID=UPI001F56222E|nr:ribosome maturation factor RimM [Sphingomonas sp. CROZ-RG-20F-R02-07]